MVRLAADMGMHKSTIIDVLRDVVKLCMEEVIRGAPTPSTRIGQPPTLPR